MTNKEKRISWPNNNNSCFTWINIHLSKCELESRNIWSTDDKEKDFHLQSFDYRLNYNFLRLSYNLSTTYWATDFFSQETFIFRWSIVVERIEMYGSDNLSYINELCKKNYERDASGSRIRRCTVLPSRQWDGRLYWLVLDHLSWLRFENSVLKRK